MFKNLFNKVGDYFVDKAISKLDAIAAQIEADTRERELELRRHEAIKAQRQRNWDLAELLVKAQREKRIFQKELNKMAHLSFTRGAEGQPLGLHISLTGLFFRFLKGNQQAVDVISEALCGMVKVQFAEAMAV